MSDLIHRADLFNALANVKAPPEANEYKAEVYKVIQELPTEGTKTGKWEFDPNGMDWNIPAWRCSECGYVASHIGIADKGIGSNPMNWAGSKYCPECGCKIVGARMRGEEE